MAAIRYDILITNAQLRAQSAPQSIGIVDGQIAGIEPTLPGEAAITIDANGNLVTESFVNPHLHLCKVHTYHMLDSQAAQAYHGAEMGKAMSAIELAARVKANYDRGWIIKNVRHALAEAALNGNTHIRALADVDSQAQLEGVHALLQAKQEFAGIVDLQVVAFAQDGLLREPEAESLLRQAMELGADVVGGIPWIEYTEADMRRHIEKIFDIAVEFDADVSMLVDDAGDPGLHTLEMMAVETIERGWHGRVLAHHARAMALYPKPKLERLIALLKQAQMGLIADPHTGPLHARVAELLAADVLVALGQDDISDAYYPFGRNNMLEVAFLAAHLLWMTIPEQIETLYEMITLNAARTMGIENFELAIGNPANLLILNAPSVFEALRYHAPPKATISQGKLIDKKGLRDLLPQPFIKAQYLEEM